MLPGARDESVGLGSGRRAQQLSVALPKKKKKMSAKLIVTMLEIVKITITMRALEICNSNVGGEQADNGAEGQREIASLMMTTTTTRAKSQIARRGHEPRRGRRARREPRRACVARHPAGGRAGERMGPGKPPSPREFGFWRSAPRSKAGKYLNIGPTRTPGVSVRLLVT